MKSSWNKMDGAGEKQLGSQNAARAALKMPAKQAVMGEAAGEPDDMPQEEIRSLEQIHQDLGRHIQPAGDGEADMEPR